MNQQFIAKTFKGLEEILAAELVALGADNIEIQRRAVAFTGDKRLLYKANLHLRTATRILKPVATFRAKTPDEIYAEVMKLDWSAIMTTDNTFAIDATVFSDEMRHSRFVAYRVKDAIVDWFRQHTGKRPSVKVDNPQLTFNVHIAQDQCTLSLDSSGESLHKRGYRTNQTEAPISEVLAAGMLLKAGWDGQTDFVDPFCGSGTILIEAAMIALNIPPGLYRPSFGFEQWNDFDKDLFDELYQDDSAERPFEHRIYGFDISGKALKIAEENIKSAGVGKYITLTKCDIAELESPSEKCLIVTNPPYGERLKPEELEPIYVALGRTLKHRFTGSTAWVISSDEYLLERVGFKPSEKVKLMNGPLDCLFNCYEVFAGKKEDRFTAQQE
jgi:putative N6-adenine-specific DNA methylase